MQFKGDANELTSSDLDFLEALVAGIVRPDFRTDESRNEIRRKLRHFQRQQQRRGLW